MKKLVSFVLVAVMLLSFSVSAMAAGFTPSVTNKGAPEIVFEIDSDGRRILGYIRDEDGNIVATCSEDCIVITSIAEAENSTKITEEEKKILQDAYNELNKTDTKLSELCPDLNDIAKDLIGNNATADNFVIRDFFDLSPQCDDLKNHLPKDGTTIDITFDCAIASGTDIVAMVYVDGKWKPVAKAVNNGNGTVTITFEEVCPVAIMVPADAQNDSYVPVTGVNTQSNALIWGSVMLVSLVSIVALVYISRRKKSYNA